MRTKILIYCDYGTNDIENLRAELLSYFSSLGISIETTDANDIIKEDSLDDTVLAFIMPGGRATPYLAKLNTLGNQKIKNYVENGGIYVGICAGAYYASQQVFFEKDVKELAIIHQCGLNLLNANAIGTLYQELKMSPYTQDFYSMAPVKIRWLEDNQTHIVSYHGGPYFQIKDKNVEILAVYELNGKELPAIIKQQQKNGFAIGIGVHVEDSGKALEKLIFSTRKDKKRAESIIKTLKENETSRVALLQKILKKIR